MKKSLFNLVAFAVLVCLSIVVPVYVLLTGSATFMPLVTAGVAVSTFAGVGAFGFVMLSVHLAENKQNVPSHKELVKLRDYSAKLPMWRKLATLTRYVTQAVLLLALGSPLSAGFVVAALVGVFLASGMIDSYFARLPRLDEYQVKTRLSNEGKLYASGVGVGAKEKTGFGDS